MKTLSDIDHSPYLRVASVISPDELPVAGIHLGSSDPGINGCALIFSLPRIFIEPFAGEGLVSSSIAVYTTSDGRENFAIISVHRAGSLLHCALPMSSPRVQCFLEDCMARNTIQFVMALDGEVTFGLWRLGYQFSDTQRLRALMHVARPISDSDAGFLELEALTSKLTTDFRRTLTPAGELRTQVVAVLSEIQRGLAGQQHESGKDQSENRTTDTTLH